MKNIDNLINRPQDGLVGKEKIVLPESFSIKITGDFSSSGATRKLKVNLVFKLNNFNAGKAKFEFDSCASESGFFEFQVENNQWVVINKKDEVKGLEILESYFHLPITKVSIENNINSGAMKPTGTDINRGVMSYELSDC